MDAPLPFVHALTLGGAADLIHRRGEWQSRALAGTHDDRRLTVLLTYTL